MLSSRTLRRVAAASVIGVFAGLAPLTAATAAPSAPAPGARYDTTLSPRLAALADGATARTSADVENQLAGLPTDGAGSLLRDDRGALLVNLVLSAPGGPSDGVIAAAGGTVTARDPDGSTTTVAVDPTALASLSVLPGVAGVVEIQEPIVHGGGLDTAGLAAALQQAGPETNAACGDRRISEADTQLGAAAARTAKGVDGTGIMVGILSDSYNNLNGAATDVANGELPGPGNPCGKTTPVQVQADMASGGSDEGRAMAQAVHDLAPGATLRYATAFNGDVDFANQIRNLAAAGADVIVDDITYLNEPMYQDGVIAKAINDVTAQGVVVFSSAQNSNLRFGSQDAGSYEAPAFRPTTCPSNITSFYEDDACHDFNPGAGVDNGNGYTLPNGENLRFLLGYSEPRYGVTTDLDLFIVDKTTNAVVAVSNIDNPASTKTAFESVAYTNTTGSTRTFDVVVGRYTAGGTPRFRVVSSRSGDPSAIERPATVGTDVVGPTSFGHNMTPKAGSIAAIPYNSNTAPEAFSSRGPVNYCWQPVVGTTPAASQACVADTIDVTATDGAVNSFFGSFVASGTYRFYGTSQAAPHAAAVAALMRQARPCRTPAQILTAQRSSAAAIGSFTVDAVGGGLLRASQAIDALAACAAAPYAPFASWNALVTRIYTDMIGVAPSTTVRNGYATRLGNGTLSPGGFVAELRVSTDHVNNVDPVTRLYRAYLLRIPDSGGLTYWIRQKRNGRKLNSISDHFAASNEFKNKYGSLSNRAFVNLIYSNVLGRPGEASGVDYWTSRLDRKVSSRGAVMTGFSESNEYKRKQVAEVHAAVIYIQLLGRAPTTTEFNNAVTGIEAETIGASDVAAAIIESAAYASRVS